MKDNNEVEKVFDLYPGSTNEEKKEYIENLVKKSSGMPIQLSIENITNKIFESVPLFNYNREKYSNHLIYKSDVIDYDTLLRYLSGINKLENKIVNHIHISASSEKEENAKKQINDKGNYITIETQSIDGRLLHIPRHFHQYNLEDKLHNIIIIPMNCSLFNRVNFIINKIELYTKVNFLIFPTEETKNF
jgi:hypothetical protein